MLKAGRITSRTDGSKNANVANDIFEEVRDELMRSSNWKFARKLAILARSATAPAYQYDYAYPLPNDWIRTVEVHDNDAGTGNVDFVEAEVAGVGSILTSVENVYIEYIYKVTDTNRMDPLFRTALSYALASNMPGISNISANAWDALENKATRRLNKAKSTDALGSPPPLRPTGSWATARQSWPSSRWPR